MFVHHRMLSIRTFNLLLQYLQRMADAGLKEKPAPESGVEVPPPPVVSFTYTDV